MGCLHRRPGKGGGGSLLRGDRGVRNGRCRYVPAFVELRPNQQYNFLKALNYLYSDYHMPTMALYPDDNGLYSKFATYIYAYYMNKLGVQPDAASESTGFDIFTDLMIALEAYANNDANTFGQCMAEVQTKYKAWSGTDKDAFDRNLEVPL